MQTLIETLKRSYGYRPLNEDKKRDQTGRKDARQYPFGEDPLGDKENKREFKSDRRLPSLRGLTEAETVDASLQDQIDAGLEFELSRMVKPNRGTGLDIVIANLQSNPRYYVDLVQRDGEVKKVEQKQAVQSIFENLLALKNARLTYSNNVALRESVKRRN
jgi:hypothetical protein